MARPKSDLAPRIIEAARLRFLLEGVDGASLRQIASDAGTNIGMIYYYYPTKDDLFFAVLEKVYEPFLVDIESVLGDDVPPDERLRRMYARIAAMSEVEFQTVRLLFREAMISSTRLKSVAERFVRGHLPRLLQTIHEARDTGLLDPATPLPVQLSATMTLAMLPQIMLRLVTATDLPIVPMLPSAHDASQALAEVLLRGLASPTPKPRPD